MLLKILAALAYLAMVTVNYLANALPINNQPTGVISDNYPNLFTPAGLTFSIWGLIYLLLAGYVLWQFGWLGKKAEQAEAAKESRDQKVRALFIISSLANIAWIFAWHYDLIALSVVIMLALLATLILIAEQVNKGGLSKNEELWLRLPFSVYFGWITVATIANITILLVSLGWRGGGAPESFWAVAVLLVGAAIGILRMRKDRNIAYGLVLVWAYGGIILKHLSGAGWNGQYPAVIATAGFSIAAFLFVIWKLKMKKAPGN